MEGNVLFGVEGFAIGDGDASSGQGRGRGREREGIDFSES